MNYHKIYQDLLEKCADRVLSQGTYVEQHHIIPKCMGGSNDVTNLVNLLPEEHLIAHLLLVKMHPNNIQLVYAANWMTSRVKNNKEYGWVKRQFAKVERNNKLGIPRDQTSVNKQKNTIAEKYANGYISPIKGRHITEDHKKAVSIGNTGKVIEPRSKSDLNGFILRYGQEEGLIRYKIANTKKRTATIEYYVGKFGIEEGTRRFNEYVNKQSDRMKGDANLFRGKHHSVEAKAKISKSNTGKNKIRTSDHNKKIGEANKGRKQEIISCPHCKKSGGRSNMKRWHFDKCPLSCATSLQ